MNKKEQKNLMEKVIRKIEEEEQWEKTIPSNTQYPIKQRGIKPTAKTYERHMRETDEKAIRAMNMDMSVTIYRRAKYIMKHGSNELKKLCNDGKISISTAYNIAKKEWSGKVYRALDAVMKENKKNDQ